MRRTIAFLAIGILGALSAACGSGVGGHTYHNNGGVVQVEFKRDGKATVSAGADVHACIYSESGNTVKLICENRRTDLQMQEDGALVGPSEGPMARLTPVNN